jgi:hypothetical protein
MHRDNIPGLGQFSPALYGPQRRGGRAGIGIVAGRGDMELRRLKRHTSSNTPYACINKPAYPKRSHHQISHIISLFTPET